MAKVRHDTKRYWLPIVIFFSGMAAMSVDFGITVLRGGSPMTPETYGPLVYSLSAMTWVYIQFFVSALAALGAFLRSFWGDFILAVGATTSMALYSVFSYMALSAPQGTLLAAGSRSWVMPCCFFVMICAWNSLNARRRRT